MIKIAPSILSADFAYLARDIEKIATADYVHVDVMDGLFVPNISIGIPVVKSIRPTTDLPLDVHLMIERPVRYVEQFCDAGADIVTCHVEADTEENILAAIDKIHAKGKKAGVVVKPRTPASAVLPFIDKVELILVMTVEPGFGGQKFMADMMPKVQAIRGYIDAMNPACELEVDGGVDGDTCKVCIASGANVLVAGSAVYKAADIPATDQRAERINTYGILSRPAGKTGGAVRPSAGRRLQVRPAAGLSCALPALRRRHRPLPTPSPMPSAASPCALCARTSPPAACALYAPTRSGTTPPSAWWPIPAT